MTVEPVIRCERRGASRATQRGRVAGERGSDRRAAGVAEERNAACVAGERSDGQLSWGVVTDPGRIRQQNEDSVLVDSTMFAVADGMGGHKAGEVASALTVQLLKRRLEPAGSLDDVLAAVVEANNEIFQAATSNVDRQGMGTTLTGLFVVPPPRSPVGTEGPPAARPTRRRRSRRTESFALINIGDSRTYLLRHGRLRRITVDHNYVQELVSAGHITDDEARSHPRRNIITRALGIDPSVRVDAWTLPIVRGDRFVVCSDGLSDEVHDNEIHQILTTVSDAQAAAEELVAAANRQGGRDNVSVIVVDVLDGAEPPAPDEELDIEPVWQPAPPPARGRSPTPRRPSQRRSRTSPPSPAPRACGWSRRRAARGSSPPKCRSSAAPAEEEAPGRRVPALGAGLCDLGDGIRDRRRIRPQRLPRCLRRGRQQS